MSRAGRMQTSLAVAGCLVAACSGSGSGRAEPTTPTTVQPVPTAIAPPPVPGQDGTTGAPPPNLCSVLDRTSLASRLGATVLARPYGWNDGGVPSLDLCAIVLTEPGAVARVVRIGVTALGAQVRSLDRLVHTLGPDLVQLSRIGDEARLGPHGVVFAVGDRVVRIDAVLTAAEAEALAAEVSATLPRLHRSSRESDGACQVSGSAAEEFLGVNAQLRRDSRLRGGLTCIWGSTDATVAIVESYYPPPAQVRLPPPARSAKPAPIGDEGYYLPEEGRLVFRKGQRIVQVSALADPSRPTSADQLMKIVSQLLPLFLR